MKLFLYFILVIPIVSSYPFEETLGKIGTKTDISDTKKAVENLMRRLIGKKSTLFNIKIIPELYQDGKDVFKIIKSESSELIEISASSGVAAAWGFHHYLKEYCNCHISWDGDRIDLPEEFPDVDVTVVANDKFRYYQNVCTTSYSFVWWNWTRWEREIDWMAMNGFNLVLAFNGQEEIWRNVYSQLGLTKNDINEHFSGPAFLSWNRMGNMRGWGGSLSTSWHKNSCYLQKLILNRMRLLGIIPVLPAFAGHVPRNFKKIFPNASLSLLPNWNNFPDEYCCPYLLDPQDPLFQKIGRLFLRQYIATYGTDHVYNCDTFNEMSPTSGDVNFLRKIGRSIYSSLYNEDPDAVWMIQGWIFINERDFWTEDNAKSLLTSIPIGRFLVLDLQAELNPQHNRLDNFFGQPFIWCMLHNFGGTLGMHGSMNYVNENVFEARNGINSTMVGTGLTPEGINQNYVMYELMMDMAWKKEPVSLNAWLKNYLKRRYGEINQDLLNGWFHLKESVYNYYGSESQHGQYIVTQGPSLKLKQKIWYRPYYVYTACLYVLKGARQMNTITDTFKNDVVDLTRQTLQLLIDDFYFLAVSAVEEKNIKCLRNATNLFINVLDDMETILASDSHFLLGRWLEDAKDMAITPSEEALYEINARNQITLWGPDGQISDYATKQWSGIVSDYYKPRWKMFFECIEQGLAIDKPCNQTKLEMDIFQDVEYPFSFNRTLYSTEPKGDSIAIALQIWNKWENFTKYELTCDDGDSNSTVSSYFSVSLR